MDKAPSASLLERVRDPGFTPRLREVDGLVDLLGDADLAKAAARAIGRLGSRRARPVCARGSRPRVRRCARTSSRRSGASRRSRRPSAFSSRRSRTRTRRPGATPRSRWATSRGQTSRPPCSGRGSAIRARRCAARSRPRSARRAARGRSPYFARRRSRTTRSSLGSRTARAPWSSGPRRAARGGASTPARSAARPVPFLALSRRGLEDLLAEELSGSRPWSRRAPDGPGRVRARLAGSIDALFAARTMLSFRFPAAERAPPTRRGALRGDRPRSHERGRAGDLRHVDGGPRPLPHRMGRRRPPARGDLGSVARDRGSRAGPRQRSDGVDLGDRRRARRARRGRRDRAGLARRSALRLAPGGRARRFPSDRRGGAGSCGGRSRRRRRVGPVRRLRRGARRARAARPDARALRQRRRSARARDRARQPRCGGIRGAPRAAGRARSRPARRDPHRHQSPHGSPRLAHRRTRRAARSLRRPTRPRRWRPAVASSGWRRGRSAREPRVSAPVSRSTGRAPSTWAASTPSSSAG